MRFEVLGPVRVDSVPVSGRLRRGLLALLLAKPNTAVSAEWLAATLWPDSRGPQKLQLLVHNLRKSLGEPDRVRFETGGYLLLVRPGELDAARFDVLTSDASAADDPARQVALLREALGLWRGEPYADLGLAELAGEARRLSERRLVALEELFAAELARGRDAAVVPELIELAERFPLRERLSALLMTALHRAGRQAEALAVYRDARQVLVDELGLDPGPQLQEAERQILAGEVARPAAARPPAQLPGAPAFVGRTAELAELDRLAAAARMVTIAGTAGVGKTALATHWARGALDRFPDGQLYVDLRGYGPDLPLPAADALAGFLRALGVADPAIPQDLAERAARFRTLVDERRMLVVLDNAATVAQVRPLLPGTPSCFVLVTSRDTLTGLAVRDGAHRVDLDRMTVAEARWLLEERLGRVADASFDDPAATRLIERCARLPLALCIAAERIGERPGRSLGDLDEELADEQLRLDLLDTGDEDASVRGVLSWSYHHLTPDAARLFRLCGLRPGPDIDGYALTALAGAGTVRATRRLVDTLVRAHLVDQVATDRYRQHDLLWAYAAELARSTDAEVVRDAALTRLLDHYRYTAAAAVDALYPDGAESRPRVPRPESPARSFASPREAEAWLADNHTSLFAAAAHGPEHTRDLSATLARYLRRGAHHADAHRLHGQALAIARDRGDRVGEHTALAGLGHVLRMTGRYGEAVEHYQQALEIARGLGDQHGELTALGGLGDTYFTIGDHRSARVRYEWLLSAARAAGHRLAELKALASLGHADVSAGRYSAGEEHYRQAYAIACELGGRGSQLTSILGLGHVHRITGRFARAAEYHREGLDIAREVGHRLAELSALHELGELASDTSAAVEYYEQALEIARAAGIRSNEALVLVSLGVARGDASLCAQALTIARESGHRLGEVEALNGLGRTAADPAAALAWHREALALAEEFELPRQQVLARDGIARALTRLDGSMR